MPEFSLPVEPNFSLLRLYREPGINYTIAYCSSTQPQPRSAHGKDKVLVISSYPGFCLLPIHSVTLVLCTRFKACFKGIINFHRLLQSAPSDCT